MAKEIGLAGGRAAQAAPNLLMIGLVCALAFQCAALLWAVIGPIGPYGPARAAQAGTSEPGFDWAVFSRFDPFFRALGPSAPAITQSGASLGLTLFAIRRDKDAGGGSAIVALSDGRQIAVRVGEEVSPGLKLQAITDDGAVFLQGGTLLELNFPAGSGLGGGLLRPANPDELADKSAAAAAPAQAFQIDPRVFFSQVRLSPARDGERVLGYTIGPESSQQPLTEAGLRKGDVLLSVNGASLSTAASLQAAANGLAGRPEAVITFERQGKSGSVTVRVAKP